VYAAAMF
jgi:dipeptidyl-peptidase III